MRKLTILCLLLLLFQAVPAFAQEPNVTVRASTIQSVPWWEWIWRVCTLQEIQPGIVDGRFVVRVSPPNSPKKDRAIPMLAKALPKRR